MTFIQSLSLVYRIFNYEIYSFVIKMAINVIKVEMLAIRKPILVLTIEKLQNTKTELDPFKKSELLKQFFLV